MVQQIAFSRAQWPSQPPSYPSPLCWIFFHIPLERTWMVDDELVLHSVTWVQFCVFLRSFGLLSVYTWNQIQCAYSWTFRFGPQITGVCLLSFFDRVLIDWRPYVSLPYAFKHGRVVLSSIYTILLWRAFILSSLFYQTSLLIFFHYPLLWPSSGCGSTRLHDGSFPISIAVLFCRIVRVYYRLGIKLESNIEGGRPYVREMENSWFMNCWCSNFGELHFLMVTRSLVTWILLVVWPSLQLESLCMVVVFLEANFNITVLKFDVKLFVNNTGIVLESMGTFFPRIGKTVLTNLSVKTVRSSIIITKASIP